MEPSTFKHCSVETDARAYNPVPWFVTLSEDSSEFIMFNIREPSAFPVNSARKTSDLRALKPRLWSTKHFNDDCFKVFVFPHLAIHVVTLNLSGCSVELWHHLDLQLESAAHDIGAISGDRHC